MMLNAEEEILTPTTAALHNHSLDISCHQTGMARPLSQVCTYIFGGMRLLGGAADPAANKEEV